eukprot:COSAG05_NODE_29515_length_107_cov_162.750000_1_plen_35_part_11
MDIHVGGRADHDGRRRFLGHMALLAIYKDPLTRAQ